MNESIVFVIDPRDGKEIRMRDAHKFPWNPQKKDYPWDAVRIIPDNEQRVKNAIKTDPNWTFQGLAKKLQLPIAYIAQVVLKYQLL